ncbi:dihydropteroate synthase [Tropicimonas sp. IMCC6043]|uniref:dihydropteroate synthase n=1 Tax=Tropicimonas sp. IMCC6043 TaxID=2510645 RepID=UPI00101B781F|nr:dihydropteroate synthase [Tropicimonas sp. IMCC6043]RYH08122.1 dihydropteroate synthase [Tropicimonas sp. IMCC6043]
MSAYYRPIPCFDPARPSDALPLAGGWCHFDRVERLARGAPPEILHASDVPEAVLARLTAPREAICGVGMAAPRLMGILNVTPDSFSDGGLHDAPAAALAHARAMAAQADFIDIGGESTRPGAKEVSVEEEIHRTAPVIAAMRATGISRPVSIDTRKAAVAAAALDAGADMVNDVSGLGFDPALAPLVGARGAPLCVMHSIATPETMQQDPRYGDVLLDVYDFLEERVVRAEAAGIPRARILVDPGIGFGKTLAHNLALLARISLFHGLGCPILLGVSRKRMVGELGRAAEARARTPGSIAAGLAAVAQGVQVLRVHDVAETAQALRLFLAATTGQRPEEDEA